MSDTAQHFCPLEAKHIKLEVQQKTLTEKVVENSAEIKELRKAYQKIMLWIAILAAGGSAGGSAIVNALTGG